MSTGHELGVDLAELWDAGQNHLPIVAGEFTKAVNALPTLHHRDHVPQRRGRRR